MVCFLTFKKKINQVWALKYKYEEIKLAEKTTGLGLWNATDIEVLDPSISDLCPSSV